MKKKRPTIHSVPPVAPTARTEEHWHNGADIEISFYARSLHHTAKLLLSRLDRTEDPKTAWDVGPIILLYRQAVELQMKFLVGEGSRFLASPTDHITLYKTRSLRWLAQIVCQIIKAVQWEAEFKCAGIANLAEFSAVIAELEGMEPISAAVHAERSKKHLGDVPPQLSKKKILEFTPKLDALIDLLAATADGLAATADLMEIGPGGHKPTIQ
ncbi:MAG: hypothetical protein JST93_26100 [Acidobacteria bacterium]|nr:hypothetical protein [Acidobacteriota bacterium]